MPLKLRLFLPKHKLSRVSGFTLHELMITIAIVGILAGIAFPSFKSTIASNRLTTSANELVTALNLARSEAVKRGQQVVVRKTGSEWENGWRVFVDINRATASNQDAYDAGTDIELRVYSGLTGTISLRGNTNFTDFVRYTPMGVLSNPAGGSFAACDDGAVSTTKLIIVNGVGRAKMASDSDHDGIPEQEGGTTEISSCTTGF
jgi:type IV fimbrial biogenesis protein FimT